MNERKRAILWLGERHVFDIFAGAYHHAFLSLPVLEGLPADVKLLQVTHSWERRAFGFMLASESFAEVPDGEFAPDLGPATKYQVVKLLRAEGHPEDSADCPAYVVPRGVAVSDLDLRYVVILGDPWGDSGVTFHGPFGSQEQAHEWGCHDDGGKGGPFSVRTLNRHPPLANRGEVLFVAKHDYRKGDTMRLRLENGVWHELPPD